MTSNSAHSCSNSYWAKGDNQPWVDVYTESSCSIQVCQWMYHSSCKISFWWIHKLHWTLKLLQRILIAKIKHKRDDHQAYSSYDDGCNSQVPGVHWCSPSSLTMTKLPGHINLHWNSTVYCRTYPEFSYIGSQIDTVHIKNNGNMQVILAFSPMAL